jgi:hypothetical protein
MRGRAWGIGLTAIAVGMMAREPSALAQDQAPAREMEPLPAPPQQATPQQATPQQAAPQQAMPPDIVRLKNGSLYRGTVMELVAGDHVDVRLPSGETKRFPMSDVDYAGPASGVPGAEAPAPASAGPPPPRPLVTIDAKAAKIHFEATSADTDFHIRTEDVTVEGTGWGWGRGLYGFASTAEAHGYAHICAAPCDVTMPVGKYRLALSQGGKKPVEPDHAVTIDGATTIQGKYVSYAGTRGAGWGLFAISLAAGFGLMAVGVANPSQNCMNNADGSSFCTPQANTGLIAAGAIVSVVGSLLSLAFILQHDRAEITAQPE